MKTTVNVVVRSAPNRLGEFGVCLRVTIGRKQFQIATGLTTPGPMAGSDFPKKDPQRRTKTGALRRMISEIEDYIYEHPKQTPDELADGIREMITGKKKPGKVFADFVDEFAETKSKGTAGIYHLTARKIRDFDKNADFNTITEQWLTKFRVTNMEAGMSNNGIAIHLRNIRTVFNHCRRMRLTQEYPFFFFKIKEERTEPNNLTVEQLRMLRDYPVEPWQEVYRDMFFLSFYLAGVNVGDLLLCEGLTNGRFVFTRRKTGKKIDLPVCEQAREILDKYKGKDYLLSVMDGRNDYHSFMKRWNQALKKIGTYETIPDKAGKRRKVVYHPLFPNLTTYSARYSFASIAANDLDISEVLIGRCLGHTWAKEVTARYIATDTRKIDRVVQRVADYLNEDKKSGN